MLKYLKFSSKKEEKSIVCYLHGYTGDIHGHEGMAKKIVDSLEYTSVYLLEAPNECQQADTTGKEWFSLNLREYDMYIDNSFSEEFFKEYFQAIDVSYKKLLATLEYINSSTGIGYDKIAIGGHSQGAMVSLYSCLRLPYCLAGVCADAGTLITSSDSALEVNSRPNIFITHGTADEFVPYASTKGLQDRLKRLGLSYELCTLDGDKHSISEQREHKIIEAFRNFLNS